MTAVQERAEEERTRVDALSERAFFFALWLPLLVVYLATASWTIVRTPDPLTNAITAWNLAENGSFILDGYEGVPPPYESLTTWIVESPSGPVSIYPPGTALLTAPIAAIWPTEPEIWAPDDPRRWSNEPVDVPIPPLAPGALVAAVTTSLALALGGVVALDQVSRAAAMRGAWLLGMGTGAWNVAADGLWQHGPAMFWVALGVFLASRGRPTGSGLAFGFGILTRPPMAVIAALVGLCLLFRRGDRAGFIRIALGSLAGLALLLDFNLAIFETYSISGGYPEWFVEGSKSTSISEFADQVMSGLFSSNRGLFVYSPFLAIQILGVAKTRDLSAPVLGAALGGLLYLLLVWKINATGSGGGFLGYRFPLEAIAASSPALIASWSWIRSSTVARFSLYLTGAWAVMWASLIEIATFG